MQNLTSEKLRHVQAFVSLMERSIVFLHESIGGRDELSIFEAELFNNLAQASEGLVLQLDQIADELERLEAFNTKHVQGETGAAGENLAGTGNAGRRVL